MSDPLVLLISLLPPVLQVDKGIQSVLCMPIFDKDGNTIGTYSIHIHLGVVT